MRNVVYLLIDSSGSMYDLGPLAVNYLNETIKTLQKESLKTKQSTYVNVVSFNTKVSDLRKNKNVKTVKLIENTEYRTGGGTSLFDAVAYAINDGLESDFNDDPDTSFLVIAITDGDENSSVEYNRYNDKLNKLIKKTENNGNWTIAFQTPRSGKVILQNLGISSDNIRVWETTEKGLRETTEKTREGLSQFYDSRSRGIRSVNNFYVQTDLTDLSIKEVKKNLDDLSEDFGIFSVSNDVQIRDFVESKGMSYIKGDSYYQLTKTEVVQENKEILIFDKNKTTIYGGDDARSLIGLPINAPAKVVPGDHANYEIFVQSTSVNRKLKKGTKVAIKIN